MKYWFLFVMGFFMLGFMNSVFANDEIPTKYFGVGATVKEVNQSVFTVKTNGKKPGEGFVFTPDEIKAREEVKFRIGLKGKGQVVFKIVETDTKGKFITESTSTKVLLTTNWKEYQLTTTLNKSTDQIDVLVVTDSKQKIVFQYRDVTL